MRKGKEEELATDSKWRFRFSWMLGVRLKWSELSARARSHSSRAPDHLAEIGQGAAGLDRLTDLFLAAAAGQDQGSWSRRSPRLRSTIWSMGQWAVRHGDDGQIVLETPVPSHWRRKVLPVVSNPLFPLFGHRFSARSRPGHPNSRSACRVPDPSGAGMSPDDDGSPGPEPTGPPCRSRRRRDSRPE